MSDQACAVFSGEFAYHPAGAALIISRSALDLVHQREAGIGENVAAADGLEFAQPFGRVEGVRHRRTGASAGHSRVLVNARVAIRAGRKFLLPFGSLFRYPFMMMRAI